MTLLVKTSGIIMLVFVGTYLGLYKSQKLKNRCTCLEKIIIASEALSDGIRTTRNDLDCIFTDSFKEIDGISAKCGKLLANNGNLSDEDKRLLTDFYGILGKSDKAGECEKINIYKEIFAKQLRKAREDYNNKSKIYKTFGFCTGLAVAIVII